MRRARQSGGQDSAPTPCLSDPRSAGSLTLSAPAPRPSHASRPCSEFGFRVRARRRLINNDLILLQRHNGREHALIPYNQNCPRVLEYIMMAQREISCFTHRLLRKYEIVIAIVYLIPASRPNSYIMNNFSRCP